MEDPRQAIISALSVKKCRIEYAPTIFICGGKMDMPPVSLRGAILSNRNRLPPEIDQGLIIAESFKDYRIDGVFTDLVSFENHLAGIAHCVLIAVESPGAIAELGAFSQNKAISERLLVFIKEDFHDDKSFIDLGIIKSLEEIRTAQVKYYGWNEQIEGIKANIPEETIDLVISDINEYANTGRSEVLDLSIEAHQTIFVSELIRLFTAVTEAEITQYLKTAGKQLSKSELKRILYILQKFDLVTKKPYGNIYYLPTERAFHKIRLAVESNAKLENVDIRSDGGIRSHTIPMACSNYYRKIDDKRRLGAIRHIYNEDGGQA